MRFLFLLFIVMPVVEMWLLIEVGSAIGALYTIGLVLLTAIIGSDCCASRALIPCGAVSASSKRVSCPRRR